MHFRGRAASGAPLSGHAIERRMRDPYVRWCGKAEPQGFFLFRFCVLQGVTTYVTLWCMIRGFKHKGLARFFQTGSKSGIQAQHAERLELVLARLSAATTPKDMGLPGLGLHPLKGDRKGVWAVTISGNWRVTFLFFGKDADNVDYEDYH
jgi:toxin HigB-1